MPGARSNIGSPVNISQGKGGYFGTYNWTGFSGAAKCPNGDLLYAGCCGSEAMAVSATCKTDFLRCPAGSDPKIAANWVQQSRVGFVDGVQEIWMRTFTDAAGTFMLLSGNANVGYGPSGPTNVDWYQQGYFSRSLDNGATWDTASSFVISDRPNIRLRDGSGDQQQDQTGGFVQLLDGSIIMPVEIVPFGNRNRETTYQILVRSTDRGATWTTYGGQPFTTVTNWNWSEASLIWLPDGRLACMARVKEDPLLTADDYTMWMSYSSDAGLTWGNQTRCIRRAASRPIEVVGPEGDLLVAYRTVTLAQASGPTAWRQSWDGGATWTNPVDIGVLSANIYGQGILLDSRPGVDGNVGFVYQEQTAQGYAYFMSLTKPAGWVAGLIVTPSTVWSQSGTTVTAAKAPRLTRTTTTAQVNSSAGGLIQFRGTHASRFSVSLDGTTWASSVTVPAGTSTIYLGVTPQGGDTTLTAQIGIPA